MDFGPGISVGKTARENLDISRAVFQPSAIGKMPWIWVVDLPGSAEHTHRFLLLFVAPFLEIFKNMNQPVPEHWLVLDSWDLTCFDMDKRCWLRIKR